MPIRILCLLFCFVIVGLTFWSPWLELQRVDLTKQNQPRVAQKPKPLSEPGSLEQPAWNAAGSRPKIGELGTSLDEPARPATQAR